MNPQIVYSNPAPQPCPTGPLPLSQIPGFFTSSCGLLNQSNANINDCSSISNSSNNLVSSATCLTASGLPHIATASPLSAPQLATFSPSMPPTSTPIVVASSTSDPTHLSTSGWPISGHEVPGLVPHQSPHSPQPQLAGVGTVPSLHISTALPSALTTTTISASVTPDFVPNLSTISSSTQASLMPFHGTHQPVSIVSATQSSEFSNGPVSNTSTISPTCRTMLVPSTRRWRSGTSIQLVSPNSPILTQTSTPISTGIVYGTTESATALASTCVSTSFATGKLDLASLF
ncbi:unnamed protein product [Protopolystoma xenopodis]|uniref:Uncharacterized protein n=1 Tax=Protopolystoma xenopodis TaxID=117903 RepID=A0A448XNH3_9PLAT|nr:unnamed protein product [Protopolystoma xenopodis]